MLNNEITERTSAGRLFSSIKNTFLWKSETPKETWIEILKRVDAPITTYELVMDNQGKADATEMRFFLKRHNKTMVKIRNNTFRVRAMHITNDMIWSHQENVRRNNSKNLLGDIIKEDN